MTILHLAFAVRFDTRRPLLRHCRRYKGWLAFTAHTLSDVADAQTRRPLPAYLCASLSLCQLIFVMAWWWHCDGLSRWPVKPPPSSNYASVAWFPLVPRISKFSFLRLPAGQQLGQLGAATQHASVGSCKRQLFEPPCVCDHSVRQRGPENPSGPRIRSRPCESSLPS
jgi:hypothetical protein